VIIIIDQTPYQRALEQSWFKSHHFNYAFCGKKKNIEHFH